jgi:hypothetical protein
MHEPIERLSPRDIGIERLWGRYDGRLSGPMSRECYCVQRKRFRHTIALNWC